MADVGGDLGGSADSKEEQEIFMRLMSERRRIQQKQDDKKGKKKAVKVRQTAVSQQSSNSLEERERGFQLYVSGANEDRVEEARRRQVAAQSAQEGMRSHGRHRHGSGSLHSGSPAGGAGREWTMETVELKGKDGAMYRCSPHGGQVATSDHGIPDCSDGERSHAGSDVGESLGLLGGDSDAEGSRPSTGASTGSGIVDRDTRGVLRLMHSADRDQLRQLRNTLASQMDRRGSPNLPPRLSSSGRPATGAIIGGDSRPSSSPAAIASAIQAENERVKRLAAGDPLEDTSSARPLSSRPSSKAGSKLPLSPEVAAACAPPSVLASGPAGNSTPSRPSPGGRFAPSEAGRSGAGSGQAWFGYPSSASTGGLGVRVSSKSPLRAPAAPQGGGVDGAKSWSSTSAPARPGSGSPDPPHASPGSGHTSTAARGFPGELADRVGRLDRKKQKALLRMLETLEDEPVQASPLTSRDPSASPPARALTSPAPDDGIEALHSTGDICLHPSGGGHGREASGYRSSLQAASQQPVGEENLAQSLRALEQFRSSQSRRFFNQLQQEQSDADEGRPDPLQLSLLDGEALRGFQQEQQYMEGQQINLEGMDIPVRGGFDDVADDRFFDERPETVLGSSLVAGQFSPAASLVIPTLPSGRMLVFNCVSTWGDQSFVGLAGIEIFDGRGFPVVMKDAIRQVSADPQSINMLPDYEHDPRTPDKLFDQVNLTRDDLHVWLAPFFPGRQAHTITVDLESNTSVSMIRIWNYNKSRQHSSRGVRDMEILLDGVPVFVGEIRQAPGVLTAPEEACEHILFTQDERVLQAVEDHDWLPEHLPVDDSDEGSEDELGIQRPPTAGLERPTEAIREDVPNTSSDGRPLTRASTERQRFKGCTCGSVTLVIHSTWGDPHYVGLTAFELLNPNLEPIAISPDCIDASPRDLNDLEGVEGDLRTADKLLDGVGCTMDDAHMWLCPFLSGPPSGAKQSAEEMERRNLVRINFGGVRHEVAGFNVWNYNKSAEDASRGVREFSVFLDDKYIANFLCRKAPGHVHFDFKQVVLLDQPPCADANVRRGGAPPVAPTRLPSRDRGEKRASSREGRSSDRRSSSRERARSTGSQFGEVGRTSSVGRIPSIGPGVIGSGLTSGSGGRSRACGAQQQYETPLHPCGFIFRLLLLNPWSDAHYIGLDGIEFYDLGGRPLRPCRVFSSHGSVRSLPGMEKDVRAEENLLAGAPGTSGRMWLAPFSRSPPNSVELVFDEPTHISCMRCWNYSRTPSRGVRDLEVYVDDLLIYQGILRQEFASSTSSTGGSTGEAVLFTSQQEIVDREKPFIYLPNAEELVTFFDEAGRVEHGRGSRPGLPIGERPMTAMWA